MTSLQTRDLGFAAWRNDLAWMERQSGQQWQHAIDAENRRFREALKGKASAVARSLKDQSMFGKRFGGTAGDWLWRGWTVSGVPFSPAQSWSRGDFQVIGWDADMDDTGAFAVARPVEDGWERFHVEIYDVSPHGVKFIERFKERAGPQVAWREGTLYWLGSSADLRYDTLKATHAGVTVDLYKTQDPTMNLEIRRGEGGSVFVLETDFVRERLGLLKNSSVEWVAEGCSCIPIDATTWLIDGKVSTMPVTTELPAEEVLIALSVSAGWAVTQQYGLKTLWDIGGTSQAPKFMITVWGDIEADPRDPHRIEIMDMRYEPYIVRTPEWDLSSPEPYPFPCSYHRYPAPMFVCHPYERRQPKGLLVIAYGAYGTPTRVGGMIPKWRELLDRGWAVVSVAAPGSGDHGIRWRRRGQRLHRQEAIDSLRDAVRDIQEELGVEPTQTALYGRSAGGLLVISTAVQNRGLVGALYLESPYVDVLRTISNPELPLTLLETREFGVGSSATNFLATGAWSPLEHIPADGLPELFVVARHDLHDLEVFPYETMKFIWRARAKKRSGQPKLLKVSAGRGHFTTTAESRAEDELLLDEWATKNRRSRYKMANRNATRRNRKNRSATRKNRRNNVAAAPANATMMGGKRRKAGRKGKGRKGTRRH